MRLPKILHCADVHLDAPFRFLGSRGEHQRLQVRSTFEKICRMAADGGFDMLLIAGDLFDSNAVSDRTAAWAAGCLQNAGLPVCICPGNHDCLDDRSVYRRAWQKWPQNVFVFADPSATSLAFQELDLVVCASPSCSPRRSDSPIHNIASHQDARWRIAMAHGSIMIPGRIEDADSPIRPEDIEASGFDYVALGHWHSWGDYSTQNVKAIYPGSPERMDFSGGLGSVAAITLDESGVHVQRVEIGLRKMREMRTSLTGIRDADEIKREIAVAADENLALRVILEGLSDIGLQVDVEALQNELAERFFFLHVEDHSHTSMSDVSEEMYPANLVIGQYVRLMKQRIEAAAGDDEASSTLEEALRLGVALLEGRQAL